MNRNYESQGHNGRIRRRQEEIARANVQASQTAALGDVSREIDRLLAGGAGRCEAARRKGIVRGRRQSDLPDIVDLRDAVTNTLAMTKGHPQRPPDPLISVDLGVEPLPIRAEMNRLSHALWNLVTTGFEAEQEGWKLHITARRCGDTAELVCRGEDPGADMRTPSKGAHALDATEGDGLRLAVCSQIAEDHGGEIEVESGPRGRMAVTLRLPLAAGGGKPV